MNSSYFLDLEKVYSIIFALFTSGKTQDYVYTGWDIFYTWLKLIGWTSAVILFVVLIILKRKRGAIVEAEDAKFRTLESSEEEGESPAAEKWMPILEHLNSENPNDWKAAILQADTILDDMIKKMGYKGENLGERLKNIEKSDFETLDSAWEAHKIRNKIAHGTSDFVLTQREANRAIDMYRQVFEEFHYI
jgi:hypothetical protein